MAGRIGRSERDEHIEWEALDTHRVEGAGIVISAAMAGQKVRAGGEGRATISERNIQSGKEVKRLNERGREYLTGQPNRKTGICDSDIFVISGGPGPDVRICGMNNGQHIYYDIDTVQDPIKIMINMSQPNIGRFWEIKITQLEFQQRAPSGCLQYHREASGIIQTMNFAVNGRHLANQDYKICMRQEM
ncbi:Uncharacterized protein GBIM_14206, partial [Gryllus bimaculatus]